MAEQASENWYPKNCRTEKEKAVLQFLSDHWHDVLEKFETATSNTLEHSVNDIEPKKSLTQMQANFLYDRLLRLWDEVREKILDDRIEDGVFDFPFKKGDVACASLLQASKGALEGEFYTFVDGPACPKSPSEIDDAFKRSLPPAMRKLLATVKRMDPEWTP